METPVVRGHSHQGREEPLDKGARPPIRLTFLPIRSTMLGRSIRMLVLEAPATTEEVPPAGQTPIASSEEVAAVGAGAEGMREP